MKAMYSTEQRGRYEAYYSNLRHEKHREEKHHHYDESTHHHHHRDRTRDRDDECHCNKYYYHHHHRHYSNRPHNINNSNRSFCKSDKCQYKLKLGDIINHKYKIVKLIGDGAFGRVVSCEDIKTSSTYAMKIIKPISRYIDSAKIEAEILYDIKEKSPDNKLCLNIIDSFLFYHNGAEYFAIVTELLGYSLYDYIKMNNYHGYPISYIQRIAKTIFTAMDFIHSMGLIFSDLKPENILFSSKDKIVSSSLPSNYYVNNDYNHSTIHEASKSTSHSSSFPLSKTKINNISSNTNYYLPLITDDIKIIDFGGALYASMTHSDIVNTRQYRAPEDVINSSRWDTRSDMWSIGCILYELYSGEILFPTHDDEEHLCLIEKLCGVFPSRMIDNGDRHLRKIFNKYNNYINYSYLHKKYETIKTINRVRHIEDVVLKQHKCFYDLLMRLLKVNPSERITCKDALKHNFFNVVFTE